MKTEPVTAPVDALFVAYENQDNLGVRSLMAVLAEAGYQTVLVPFAPGMYDQIAAEVRRWQPRLIGFSIIFQYSIGEFAQLARHLRQDGSLAHFTAGGHFPSIRPEQVMELVPELDSIVCFEGEYTLLELVRELAAPARWPEILGLAYRGVEKVCVNPPRPLVPDLDTLPRLIRGPARELSFGIRTASMLASRGCLYDCTFCSIRQFYQSAPGVLRRTRSPEAVVAEMVDLYEQDQVRFFNFQDDDFAAHTPAQRRWLSAFLDALASAGLADKVIWKIACRVDDVEVDILRRCQEHGLVGVYLGVESGNPTGLKTLNKHVTVEQNASAVQTLKNLHLSFEMGFMLFDPSSTVETVAQNIRFLKRMMSDGAAAVNFCKMLPYAGTPIEAQLSKEGRLRGSISQPDYYFLDPRLDFYAHFVHMTFQQRNFKYSGLVERLCACLFDVELARLAGVPAWPERDQIALRRLVRRVNSVALSTLQAALDYMAGAPDILSVLNGWGYLRELTAWEQDQEAHLDARLDRIVQRCNPELGRQMKLVALHS